MFDVLFIYTTYIQYTYYNYTMYIYYDISKHRGIKHFLYSGENNISLNFYKY